MKPLNNPLLAWILQICVSYCGSYICNCLSVEFSTIATLGTWNILIQFQDTTITIRNGLTIEEKKDGKLNIEILGADKLRSGRPIKVTVRVTNTGNTQVSSTTVIIQLRSSDPFISASIDILSKEDKELFKQWGLDSNDFIFTDTGDLDGNTGTSKTGILFASDLKSKQSTEIVVNLKTNNNIRLPIPIADYKLDIGIGSLNI